MKFTMFMEIEEMFKTKKNQTLKKTCLNGDDCTNFEIFFFQNKSSCADQLFYISSTITTMGWVVISPNPVKVSTGLSQVPNMTSLITEARVTSYEDFISLCQVDDISRTLERIESKL